MKTANVTAIHDRGPLNASRSEGASNGRVQTMATLLRRFPAIDDEQRLQLLDFMTRGVPEEIVQVTHMSGLEPQVIAFRKAHPGHFPSTTRAWLPIALLFVMSMLALAWHMLA